jgi:hypothetical protein
MVLEVQVVLRRAVVEEVLVAQQLLLLLQMLVQLEALMAEVGDLQTTTERLAEMEP